MNEGKPQWVIKGRGPPAGRGMVLSCPESGLALLGVVNAAVWEGSRQERGKEV